MIHYSEHDNTLPGKEDLNREFGEKQPWLDGKGGIPEKVNIVDKADDKNLF